MHRKFHEKMEEMLRRDAPFIVATVIDVRGSAAAKPGAKAIIDEQGRAVFGWVGGGCVESFVCTEAREALATGMPRIITADLEDELTGVGLPCGGVMQIFIEPVTPRRRVLVLGGSALALEASAMLERAGFTVTHEGIEFERGSSVIIAPQKDEALSGASSVLEAEPDYAAFLTHHETQGQAFEQLQRCGIKEDSLAGASLRAGLDLGGSTAAELALSVVAEMLAATRGASARPLQETRMEELVSAFEAMNGRAPHPEMVIIGHSGITEELAWLAKQLGWRISVDSTSAAQESYPAGVNIIRDDADFSRLPASSESAVIVATHHKGDHTAIERALAAGAWYVGLIASAHRSKLVRAMLLESLHGDERLQLLRTPSGLDLGATTPSEIALSIMSEVLACYHGRTGQPRLPAQFYEKSGSRSV
jgi:xanthine dehydrogenase accessory factor